MPQISVIVPVYNCQKYLSGCIQSILNQTFQDFEIVLVNDGSTDRSLALMRKFELHNQDKIVILQQENSGPGAARNAGLAHCSGKYIKFVDADDRLPPDSLSRMYSAAENFSVPIVTGNQRILLGPTSFHSSDWNEICSSMLVDIRANRDYIVTESPGIGNKLILRDLIGDIKFPVGIKWEDLAIVPALLAAAEKVYYLNEDVYYYRIHKNSTTVTDFLREPSNFMDIFTVLDFAERNIRATKLGNDFDEQIRSLYILHTLYRVQNAMHWPTVSLHRKNEVIDSLLQGIEERYPDWRIDRLTTQYRERNRLFDRDMRRFYC